MTNDDPLNSNEQLNLYLVIMRPIITKFVILI